MGGLKSVSKFGGERSLEDDEKKVGFSNWQK
jgi:hypothetical protein